MLYPLLSTFHDCFNLGSLMQFKFYIKSQMMFHCPLKGAEEFCVFMSECIFIQNTLPVEMAKVRSCVMQILVRSAMHLKLIYV